jgi:flagellar motor component MotA
VLELMQNLVALFGLLAAAVGAGGVALVVAKQVGIDARILRGLSRGTRTPEGTVDLVIHCAELASREGLLKVEAHVANFKEPLLARGVSLALEGKGEADMRRMLDAEIEAAAADGAVRARLMALVGAAAQIGGIILATMLLIGCLTLASGLSGSVSGILLLLGGTTGLLSIVAGSLWSDAAARTRAADTLCNLIIAEGVLMLRSGRDPRFVAAALGRMLPSDEPNLRLVKAA